MTQFFILPIENGTPVVVTYTTRGWLQCRYRPYADTILFNPGPIDGEPLHDLDLTAYPIPSSMLTTPSWSGWCQVDPQFYAVDWDALSDDGSEYGDDQALEDWEEFTPPEYEESCQGLPLYEDVPPPAYDVAILSPPAY